MQVSLASAFYQAGTKVCCNRTNCQLSITRCLVKTLRLVVNSTLHFQFSIFN